MRRRTAGGTHSARIYTRAEIGRLRVVGYGSGDFAFNLSFTFASLFLLYFYTDVLRLSGTTAGLIMLVALVWEGVTDPLVGMVANRTNSRWGRYRPYLLFGAIPLAVSFSLMFLPLGLAGLALVGYVALTQGIYRTIFTFVNVPYVALSAQMTSDTLVRGQLAAARMIFAIACGIAISALTLPLVKVLGSGVEGFFKLSLIYGVVATAMLLSCFAVTREARPAVELRQPGIREMIRSVSRNKAFLLLLGATMLGAVAYTMSNKALVYYMKYVVGSEEAVTMGLLSTLSAAAASMIPWVLVTKRTSKKTVWLSGAAITSAALLAIFVLGPTGGPVLWSLLALTGIGNAAFILTFWSMLPDTIEFGEWKSGTRAEGAIMGLTLFTQKVALGVGTGMVGILLDLIGYVPDRRQGAATLQGILLIYTVVPTTLFLGAAGIVAFYPLDRVTHQRLVRVVERRRNRDAAQQRLDERGGLSLPGFAE